MKTPTPRPAASPGTSPAGRTAWTAAAVALTAVAVLIRLNNGVRFPSLNGYDSFGHLTYIWYLLKTGRVPLADQGWSFFHPPLYYALAAAIWAPLRAVEPKHVLKIISITFSLLGLISAWVSYRIARDFFPANPRARVLAPLFVLFVPVGLYTAPMLGNEGLNTVLCSLALYALLRTLRRPGWRAALLLGVVLGLAMLTKATATGVLAASVVALALWTVQSRRWHVGLTCVAVAISACFAISGWYYARNLVHFGTPFAMSRGYLVVAHVESALAAGDRGPLAYLSFDPRIFVDPQYVKRPVIDSVWTGAFAGTWFDVVGKAFTPPVDDDARARWAGQLLIALGVLPTCVVLIGLAAAVLRLLQTGWDDTLVVMLLASAFVIAMFAAHTYRVPVFSAVKASYLLPAVVPFSFWFALGVEALSRWRRCSRLVLIECGALLAAIVPVFTYQLVFAGEVSTFYWNALGATYYLAGFPGSAQEILAAVARETYYYAAHENLAILALEEGRLEDALAELEQARQLAPEQGYGTEEQRETMSRLTVAEYDSTEAVIYSLLGRDEHAIEAARRAVAGGPHIPEAHYNLAALLLRSGALDAAWEESRQAGALDPRFSEVHVLIAIAAAQRGDCGAAVEHLRRVARETVPDRTYPWQTGTGDLLDAGVARRRIITLCSGGLNPYAAMRACAVTGEGEVNLSWLPAVPCNATSAAKPPST